MHSFTTDTISGLVVLLITVLVVDQVIQFRQNKNRSVATAAQGAILMAQADRSSRAVSAVFDGSGNKDAASNEVRTFMALVLIAAPVLMDPQVARRFLEQSQRLSAELARALHAIGQDPSATTAARDRVDAAVDGLRNASHPVIQTLNPQQRAAAAG